MSEKKELSVKKENSRGKIYLNFAKSGLSSDRFLEFVEKVREKYKGFEVTNAMIVDSLVQSVSKSFYESFAKEHLAPEDLYRIEYQKEVESKSTDKTFESWCLSKLVASEKKTKRVSL